MVTSLLLIWLLGFMSGACLVMGYGLYQIEKMKQIRAKATEEEDKKKKSVKDRIAQVHELAQNQIDIIAQLEMPSKNALHSKFKSDLVGALQDIECKKLDILKTVLADGFNPMI